MDSPRVGSRRRLELWLLSTPPADVWEENGGRICGRSRPPLPTASRPQSARGDGGSTTARVQASVLSLYDKARLRGPYAGGKAVDMFSAVDQSVISGLQSGKPAVLLTGTILSPTVKAVIQEFLAKYPGSRHVQYDAVSYSGMILDRTNSELRGVVWVVVRA